MMVVIQWKYVEGECCSSSAYDNKYFTHGSPCKSFCCGCGPCNIFCCNCADGCRKSYWDFWKTYHDNDWYWLKGKTFRCGHKKKRQIDSYYSYSKAQELFNEVDADGSRNITIDEADQYLKGQSKYKRDTKFSLRDEIEKMDANEDGIISPFEFDSSLNF